MIEDQNDQISVILCCGYKLETEEEVKQNASNQ